MQIVDSEYLWQMITLFSCFIYYKKNKKFSQKKKKHTHATIPFVEHRYVSFVFSFIPFIQTTIRGVTKRIFIIK